MNAIKSHSKMTSARSLLLLGAATLALLLAGPRVLSPLVLVAAGDDGWTYGRASFVSFCWAVLGRVWG